MAIIMLCDRCGGRDSTDRQIQRLKLFNNVTTIFEKDLCPPCFNRLLDFMKPIAYAKEEN
jgi:hypothetical protein